MTETSTFKQIIGYVDQLNRDVGQLVVLIERLMREQEHVSLKSAGRQICWALSHSYQKSSQWRLPHAARFFTRAGTERVTTSAFYLILLEVRSAFPFPVVICGRMCHEPMTESQILGIEVFSTARIKSLAYKRSQWHAFRQERGWYVAEPSSAPKVKEVWGYILNLFDVEDTRKARDNIVTPLIEWERGLDLSQALTIPCYAFPEMLSDE